MASAVEHMASVEHIRGVMEPMHFSLPTHVHAYNGQQGWQIPLSTEP